MHIAYCCYSYYSYFSCSNNSSLRSENIQMLTALVMQLIQCVAVLPEQLGRPKKQEKAGKKQEKQEKQEVELGEDGLPVEEEVVVDRDVLVNNNYESAMATAFQFLTVFLKKCGAKGEDVDYRPLFENFLQVGISKICVEM